MEDHYKSRPWHIEGAANVTRLSEIQERPIEWFWDNRIPYGKLTVLDGNPGVGKSVFMCLIAALASQGKPLPGENPDLEKPICRTLILSEDDAATSIAARMRLANANLDRIMIHQGVFGKKMDDIEPFTLDQISNFDDTLFNFQPDLVIIDPILNFLNENADTNSDIKMRRLLKPLDKLAGKYDCAIVGLRHLNKDNFKTAIQRGSGSMQFAGTARSVFMVVEHPKDKNLKVLCRVKTNDGPPVKSIVYSIQSSDDGKTPYARFEHEEDIAADDVVLGMPREDDKEPTKREAAKRLLRVILRNGPVPAKEAQSVIKKEWNIGERTIDEAKKDLVETVRIGDEWVWSLADVSNRT